MTTVPDRRPAIVTRWATLLLAVLLVLWAAGIDAGRSSPSALRVSVAAVVALLAPLFWPGAAPTRGRMLVRVGAWSLAATALAAVATRILGGAAALTPVESAGLAVLLALLLLGHGLAALLERRLQRRGAPPATAREAAAGCTALGLALLATSPLWLGPLADVLSPRHDGLVDALVAASPMTHLAVAAGHDLLRGDWLYQHSNLAALPVSYPHPLHLAAGYGLALAALAAALSWRPATASGGQDPIEPSSKENCP